MTFIIMKFMVKPIAAVTFFILYDVVMKYRKINLDNTDLYKIKFKVGRKNERVKDRESYKDKSLLDHSSRN